jgi:hypothetical protein
LSVVPTDRIIRIVHGYDDNRLSLAQRDNATALSPTRLLTSNIAAGSNRLASQSITGRSGTTSRGCTCNGRGDVTDDTRDGSATSAGYE